MESQAKVRCCFETHVDNLECVTPSDWVQDKIRSKFAFEALCWQKSHIPLLVWQAGDITSNLVESAHLDVNHEGLHCTLVGGIKKGQVFDILKAKTLQVCVFLPRGHSC